MAKVSTIKRVNVYPPSRAAIFTPNRKIVTPLKNVQMSTREILHCLSARAKVEEILSDGTTVQLSVSNYNTNNEHAKKVVREDVVVAPKNAPVDVVAEVLEKPNTTADEVIVQPDIVSISEEEVPLSIEEEETPLSVRKELTEDEIIEMMIKEEEKQKEAEKAAAADEETK